MILDNIRKKDLDHVSEYPLPKYALCVWFVVVVVLCPSALPSIH